jgi:hypothetical protein
MFIQELIKKFLFDDTDVGPYRPPGTSPIQRRGEVAPVADGMPKTTRQWNRT